MHPLRVALPASLLAAGLLVTACGDQPPEPRSLTVGAHRLELVPPAGWEHLDHGREQRFDLGVQQISLADMGPVTREGFEREVVHARELYRAGQLEDARAWLQDLRLRPAFPSQESWRSFVVPWDKIRRAGQGLHPANPEIVEPAYTEVLAQIAALSTPDLSSLSLAVLQELGHDERYDIADQRALAISGRPALLIDTWDRLSHAQRRRHVFVLNGGNLLVCRMELGSFAEMEPVFDGLVESLELLP